MFHLTDPKPDMVVIDDIAHSLANLCRFTGHSKVFYSVAQHCVLCALQVEDYIHADSAHRAHRVRKVQRLALMHDAAEAYVGDMSSPLKMLFPEFRIIEERIQAVVHAALGIESDTRSEATVRDIDFRMLFTEKRDVLAVNQSWPVEKQDSFVSPIPRCWPPAEAYANFKLAWMLMNEPGALR